MFLVLEVFSSEIEFLFKILLLKIFSISSSVHLQLMILYSLLEHKEEWFAFICCPLMSVWKSVHSNDLYPTTTYLCLINSPFPPLVTLVFLIKKYMWYLNNTLFA